MNRRNFIKTSAGLFVAAAPAIIRPRGALAQLAGGLQFPGPGTPHSAGGYVGPVDLEPSNVSAWYGLRACSAAYATGSNPAIDICDSSGNNVTTINILANGNLDNAAVSTFIGFHGTPSVKRAYEQIGGVSHLEQATPTNMPTLTLTAIGSRPGLVFNGTTQVLTGAISGITTTGTFSTVAKRTGNTSAFNGIASAGLYGPGYNSSPDQGILFQGSVSAPFAMTDNAFHALQAIFAGGSSIAYMDGTNNTGLNPGSSGFGGTSYSAGVFNGSLFLTGILCELGIWNTTTFGNSAVNGNQHTYWGF